MVSQVLPKTEMEDLLKDPRVQVAYADQCQFGLTAKIRTSSDERGPAKKPTGFISNSWTIAHRLRRTCKHDHDYVKLEGGRAKAAALYPDELCMEMCKGLKEQIECDAKGMKCLGELSKKEAEDFIRDMIETAKSRQPRTSSMRTSQMRRQDLMGICPHD